MGSRGPAPKTAEQRAVEGGTPGQGVVSHRPVPDVVQFAPRIEKHDIPKPPDDIPQEGKELWEVVMPWLVEVNAVQLIDLPAIKQMCVAYANAERARKVLDEQGWFVLGSMGQMTDHPAMKLLQQNQALALRFMQDFGLTTMARTRLGLMDVQRKSIAQEMDWTLGPSTRRTDGE